MQKCIKNHFSANIGDTIDIEYLNSYLVSNGYLRTETVREPGEYAVRGGIIDIYPAGIENPLRLDLFGDTIEYIRSFDALTQRSISELKSFNLTPANEIIISDDSWEMFRNKYREVFGPVKNNDHLFEAISTKNRHPGMEHWAPLFYESMSTIFDYVSGNIILGLQAEEALISRQELIKDYYEARLLHISSKKSIQSSDDDIIYNPLPPDFLYISSDSWKSNLSKREVITLSAFQTPNNIHKTYSVEGRSVDNFSEARKRQDINLLDAFSKRVQKDIEKGIRVLISAYSKGSRDRLVQLLNDHGISGAICVDTWLEACDANIKHIPIFVLGLDTGFSIKPLTIYSEKDNYLSESELINFLIDAEAAIIGRDPVTQSILKALPELKIISKYGVGFDNLDLEAIRKNGVELAMTAGTNKRSVAELTLSFMVGLCHNIFVSAERMKKGNWIREGGQYLSGKTIGIIGCGNVGKEVVKLLKPFDCEILINDIEDMDSYCKKHCVKKSSFKFLIETSDIVSCLLYTSPSPRDGLLSRMPSSA